MKARHMSPNMGQKSGPRGHKGGELISQMMCTRVCGIRCSTETSQRKEQNSNHEWRELEPLLPTAHAELTVNHALEIIAYILKSFCQLQLWK